MTVAVVTAAEAAARDSSAIASGIPSRALMQRAGAAAAGEIARRYARRLRYGVTVFAGPGNNGGDGWVVARALAAAGVRVSVVPTGAPRTDDARAEMELALPLVETREIPGGTGVVVDALLGTGATGAPRGAIAAGVATIAALRERGAPIVALDVPSGVDASRGDAEGAVRAELTITFGTMKRGLLVARAVAGTIVVVDIGLRDGAGDDAPLLVEASWVRARLPGIPADAHKGTRKKLLVVGGAPGMAGAAVLAGRAALSSGAGMVRLAVAPASVPVVQGALPEALASTWPASPDEAEALLRWADALLIGPGLGAGDETRLLVADLLSRGRHPAVLDADALNIFQARTGELARLLGGRPAVLTPHPAEFARLADLSVEETLDERFDVGARLARAVGAAVLLKGVPTVVSDERGPRFVCGTGSPALATAGSGDLLGGVIATLLAQGLPPHEAAAAGAWAHGRAGELAVAGRRSVRGATLRTVQDRLGDVWSCSDARPVYPVLVELPAVGE